MTFCVNTSSKQFKEVAAKYRLAPSFLESLVHRYINAMQNPDAFPSNEWIESQIVPKFPVFSKKEDYEAASKFYAEFNPFEEYTTFNEAQAVIDNSTDKYPAYAFTIIQNGNEKFEVLIGQPQMASSIDSNTAAPTNTTKPITFNKGQQAAIDAAKAHIEAVRKGKASSPFFLIQGAAGTGKTTILPAIIDSMGGSAFAKPVVAVGALSHKASMVIGSKLGNDTQRAANIKVKSVAGLLGLKEVVDDKTGNVSYESDPYEKPIITSASLVIIDEASMIGEKEMALIEKALKGKHIPVIFLGDRYQLPPVRIGKKSSKDLSPVFTRKDINNVSLTEKVRQGKGSPIIRYAQRFIDIQDNEEASYPTDIAESSTITDTGALIVQRDEVDLVEQLLPLFNRAKEEKNPNLVKIVSYTVNDKGKESAVSKFNRLIREHLYPDANPEDGFYAGDLVVMRNSWTPPGANSVALPNSTEGSLESVSKPTTKQVIELSEDVLSQLDLKEVAWQEVTIKVNDMNGERLITLPALVNTSKNKAAFNHNKSVLWKNKKLPGVKKAAIDYSYHHFGDMGFAYAINAHKSQGSTYDVVAVDCQDINSLRVLDNKAKAQATYVGITRAANVAIISSASANEQRIYTDIAGINDRINAVKAGTATEESYTPAFEETYFPEVTEEEAQSSFKKGKKKESVWQDSEDVELPEDVMNADIELTGDEEIEDMSAFLGEEDDEEEDIKPLTKPKKDNRTPQQKSYDAFKSSQTQIGSQIEFDEATHSYKVRGVANDFSVTELGSFLRTGERAEKKTNAWLEVASRLGTTHDTVLRDYFNDSLEEKYPNLTKEQLQQVIKQAIKLEKSLKKQYGENAIFITDENLLRLASNVEYEGVSYLIAGTMDMVVIPDGSKGSTTPVVVDFKTMRSNSKKDMSAAREDAYAFQTAMYAKMLSLQIEEEVTDTYIAQFNVKYENPADVTYTGTENSLQIKVNGDLIQYTEEYQPGVLHKVFAPKATTTIDDYAITITSVKNNIQKGLATAKVAKRGSTPIEYKKTLDSHFTTHTDSKFSSTTQQVISESDLVLDVSADYRTPTSKAIKNAAEDKYAGSMLWRKDSDDAPMFSKKGVDKLITTAKKLKKPITLAILGNDVATLKAQGYTQKEIDKVVLNAIKYMQKNGVKIKAITSTGQTGTAEAGIKAAQKLGIGYTILAPKGWGYTDINGKNVFGKPNSFKARFAEEALTSASKAKEESEKEIDEEPIESREERLKRIAEEKKQSAAETKKNTEAQEKALLAALAKVQAVEENTNREVRNKQLNTPYYGIELVDSSNPDSSFTAKYALHIKKQDPMDTIDDLKIKAQALKALADSMEFSSSFSVSGRVAANMLITIDALNQCPNIYEDGSSEVVSIAHNEELCKLAESLKLKQYNKETKELAIPNYTVGFKRTEIEKRKQLDTLLHSSLLTAQEMRSVATGAIYKMSEIITQLSEDTKAKELYLNEELLEATKDADFTTMSRIDIIKEIGIGNLLNMVKDRVFGANPNDSRILAKKKALIRRNWAAFRELGYDSLIGLEEISLDERENVKSDIDTLSEDKSEQEIQEIFGSSIEHWQVGFRQVSAFNSLSQMMKRMLSNLYEVDDNFEITTDSFGLGKHISAQEATSIILHLTQGAKDIDAMIALLKEYSNTFKWIPQLTEQLENPKNEQLRSQFYTNFRKYFQMYSITYKKGKGKNATTEVKIINRSQYSDTKLLECKAKENAFALGSFPLKTKEGKLVKEKINRLNDIDDIFQGWINDNLRRDELIAQENYHTLLKEAAEILGIDTPTEESFNRIFGVKNNFTNFAKRFHYLLDNIKEDTNVTSQREYAQLVEILSKEEGMTMESVSYEAGKLHYSYVLPSYLGKLIEQLQSKNMNEKEYSEWVEREYGQYAWFKKDGKWRNHWLEVIASSKGTEQSARANLAHVVSLQDKDVAYVDKTPAAYISSMMQMYFYDTTEKWAYYRVPMMANKPSEEYIKFHRYADGKRGGASYKKYIIRKMFNIFTQELDRINAVRERNGFKDNEAIDKDFKITSKGKKATFDKNGLQFTFEDYLPVISKEHTENGKSFHRFESTLSKNDEDYEDSVLFAELLEKQLADKMGNEGEDNTTLIYLFNKFTERGFNENFNMAKAQWEREGFISYNEKGKMTTSTGLKVNNKPITLEDMEEFYWNDAFAAMNILQLTIVDTALYVDTEDLQKRFAQIHAPGTRANLLATFNGKKYSDGIERTIYLKDDIITSDIIPNLRQAFHTLKVNAKSKEERIALEQSETNILSAFADVNVADAQGYSSPTSYRKKMGLFGKWDARMEEAYGYVTNPESIPDSKSLQEYIDILWQPLKPFVYTQVGVDGHNSYLPKMKIGIQNKNSEYVLIMADAIMRSANRSNKLSALYDIMEESQRDSNGELNGKGIDTIQFMSAVNTGCKGVLDINDVYDAEGNVIKRYSAEEIYDYLSDTLFDENGEYNTDYVQEIPFEDYMIQQEVPAHFRGHSQAHGSQDRILTFADVADTDSTGDTAMLTLFRGTEDETTVSVAKARENYFKAITDNIHDSLSQLERRFGLVDKNGNYTVDRRVRNKKLSQVLRDTILKDSRFGSDMLWACDLNPYGEFNVPLSDPIQSNRIQQLLNSIIKNAINKQEIAGGPVVQVSSWGTSDELHIRFRTIDNELMLTRREFEGIEPLPEDYKEKYLSKDGYSSYEEYLLEQDGVAHFECYVPIQDENIVKDFELPDGSIDIKAMEKANPKLLEMVGYRIPTESKYSMVPIKIKGFLPRNAGEGIMMPAEITTLAGSDFDIDKLYIMRYQLIRDKEGNWASPEENTRAYRDNLIIGTQLAVLQSEQVMKQLFTPGNFDEPKMYGYLVAYIQDAVLRKGVTAKEAWAEAMTQREKLGDAEFTDWCKKETKSTSNLCFNQTQVQFHKQNMTAGKLIGVFAQANVSHAFVSLEDNTYLNIPEECSLTLAGKDIKGNVGIDNTIANDGITTVSNTIAAFLAASVDAVKDPVLNLTNINADTCNVLTALLRMGYDSGTAMLFTAQPVIKQVVQKYGIAQASGRVSMNTIIQETLTELAKECDAMIIEADTVIDKQELIDNLDGSNPEVSYHTLSAFSKLSQIAEAFGDITHMTRYNSIVSAVGPCATDTMLQRMKVEAFENNKMIPDSVKEALKKQPILSAFRVDADTIEKSLLGANMIQASSNMDIALRKLGDKLSYSKGVPADVGNAFSDFYMTYYVNASSRGTSYDLSKEHRHYMLYEFPVAFSNLKKQYTDNVFINSIQLVTPKENKLLDGRIDSNNMPYLQLKTRGLSAEVLENIKQGWSTLAKEAPELSSMLIEYNFFRHGFGFSPLTFMSLVPNTIKNTIPNYIATLNNKDSQLSTNREYTDRMINQFILHNPNLIRFAARDIKDYEPDDLGNNRFTISKEPIEGNKHKARPINAEVDSFIKIGNDIYYVEEYSKATKSYILEKVEHLGGNGKGFEIDLSTDFPKSVFNQEINNKGRNATDATTEEGISQEDMLTLMTTAFEGDYERVQDMPGKAIISELNEFLSNSGIDYTIPNTGLFRKYIVKVQDKFEKGIFGKIDATLESLNLKC